jgi:hypothetical protein
MASTAKAVNYTPAQEAQLKAEFANYKDADTQKAKVEEFAKSFGKNARSIVAKLSNMQLYVKATPVTKTGAKIESKADIVDDIALLCGDGAGDLSSLEGATKNALFAIRRALKVADTDTDTDTDTETDE